MTKDYEKNRNGIHLIFRREWCRMKRAQTIVQGVNENVKKLTKADVSEKIRLKLLSAFSATPENASNDLYYKACVMVLNDCMNAIRVDFDRRAREQGKKQVCYLCMEFLLGRSFKNTLYNLNLESTFRAALKDMGVTLEKLYELEPDAGLGNGGLGRLAACIMDGLATGEYPAMGYSIKYEYGIFRQKLEDGWQMEMPDFWLPGGEVWFEERPELAVTINFDGHIDEWWDNGFHHVEHRNSSTVRAVPSDMMIAGKDGNAVSVLRLWSASAPGFDMSLFNQGDYLRAVEQNAMAEVISKVLYPSDNHAEGKSLRLRQQYFLVSASVQDIVRRHLQTYGSLESLPDHVAIHINDTHPALCVPELMRILLDECGFAWEPAWRIVSRTIAYTNHTVMKEALECWGEDMFRHRLPRIYQIVKEIDRRFRDEVLSKTGDPDLCRRVAIVEGGVIRMANLSVAAGHKVNGVSRLHSEILKDSVFHDFYTIMPEKFTNVTNGIAHRRWLCQANPELTALIEKRIGNGFVKDLDQLEKLNRFADDPEMLEQLAAIKRNNKVRLSNYLAKTGVPALDPDSIFDVQVKRLHEYKRQHLNALHIIDDYLFIRNHPNAPFTPKTYLFGAKAASGYFVAKQIIQLICKLSQMIDADPLVREKLRVVYVEDYRVTLAELLMPAADISEQISLAGTEASGTGNMKLMLNGAVTLGTEDGANVEIHEAVGDDNILIFGMLAHEVDDLRARGYKPSEFYHGNERIRQAVDFLRSDIAGMSFDPLADDLIQNDYYMVLADFISYCEAQEKASRLFNDKQTWQKMSLANIAGAGRFSIDRLIEDYSRDIWGLTKVGK